VALATQQPFVFHASVRDNILFGAPFDAGRYERVIAATALETDMARWPGGDAAELGSNGINVSGGQRARISLARALYAAADVVLMDDPFAALDTRVARHVFTSTTALLRERGATVVFATHALQFATQAPLVVELSEGGKVTFTGTGEEYAARRPGLAHMSHASTSDEAAGTGADAPAGATPAAPAADEIAEAENDGASAGADAVTMPPAPATANPPTSESPGPQKSSAVVVATGQLSTPSRVIAAEERGVGAVSLRTWGVYFASVGGLCFLAMCLTTVLVSKGARQVSRSHIACLS